MHIFCFFFVFLYFNTYPFPTVNTISSFISAFVQDFSECRAHVFIFNQVLSLQRRNIFHKLFELHSVFVIFLLQHLLLPQLIRQLGSLGNYQKLLRDYSRKSMKLPRSCNFINIVQALTKSSRERNTFLQKASVDEASVVISFVLVK